MNHLQQAMVDGLIKQGRSEEDAYRRVIEHHAILSEILISSDAWVRRSIGYIVGDIAERYIPDGFPGEICEGPMLERYIVQYKPLTQVLDELAMIADMQWRWDWNKALIFQ